MQFTVVIHAYLMYDYDRADIYGKVTVDVLVSNIYQTISNHHDDLTMNSFTGSLRHTPCLPKWVRLFTVITQ